MVRVESKEVATLAYFSIPLARLPSLFKQANRPQEISRSAVGKSRGYYFLFQVTFV